MNFKILLPYYKNFIMNKKMSLENIIGEIRDILRKEGITGIDSINHCILFVVARWLTIDKCRKLNIPEIYSFEKIMEKTDEDDKDDDDKIILYPRFYGKGQHDCLVYYIYNTLGFTNIKFNVHNMDNLESIFKKLKKIDLDEFHNTYDIIGTVYELHLKTGSSNPRDLGQYFTDRRIIEYMVNICEPQYYEDGTIDKIVDPTMGTAGFLTMAIKYLNKNYDIDWKENIERIYGFDIDPMVTNMARLNVWLENGELPQRIRQRDTLCCDLAWGDGKTLKKADVILANMPYGLKNIVYKKCCKRIRNLGINGSSAEPLFLQLFMEALNDGGRCAVVIPNGMLFKENKQYVETRKYLMEHFNLKKVIKMNGKFFLNTGVGTSILYFVNDGYQTNKIEFCEIQLENNKIIEESIIKVKMSKIKENKYSLSMNIYNIAKIEKIKYIEYKKLGEICEFKASKYNSGDMDNNGSFDFYNGCAKNPVGKHSLYNFDYKEYIAIIKGGGAGEGKYGEQIGLGKVFYLTGKNAISNGLIVLNVIDNNVSIKYLFHILKNMKNTIMDLATYTTGLGNIKQGSLKNIDIPILPVGIQNKIVGQLDVISNNIEHGKQQIKEYKNIIKYYLQNATVNENDCKLGDICELKIGGTPERKNNAFWDNGSNLWVSVSELNDNIITNTKEKITDGGVEHSNVKLINKNSVLMSFKMSLGKKAIAGCELYTNEAIVAINPLSENMLNKYVYYYINIFDFYEACGSIGGGSLNSEKIYNLKIRVPSIEKQKEIVDYCDNITDIINKIRQQNENNNVLMKNIIDYYTTVGNIVYM